MLGRTFVKEISSAIHRAYSLTLFILFLFSQTLLIQFLFLCPCVLFASVEAILENDYPLFPTRTYNPWYWLKSLALQAAD